MTLAHAVLDDASASLGQNIQPTFGYYRQPNGWITVSPITRLERISYIEQGWTHLDQYGAFDMTPYVANHPLEGLLMFGGVSELSVGQILQSGLYLDPPLVPRCKQHLTQFHRVHKAGCWQGAQKAVFPQLAGVPGDQLKGFPCGFCVRILPTAAAQEQHQKVAHSTDLGNVRTGRTMGDSLAAALSGIVKPQVAASPASVGEMERLRAENDRLEAEIAKVEAKRAQMQRARDKRKPARAAR